MKDLQSIRLNLSNTMNNASSQSKERSNCRNIKKLLSARAKAAEKFNAIDSKIIDWLINNGYDINDYELQDHIFGGCVSIVEPHVSEKFILDYINNQVKPQ